MLADLLSLLILLPCFMLVSLWEWKLPPLNYTEKD